MIKMNKIKYSYYGIAFLFVSAVLFANCGNIKNNEKKEIVSNKGQEKVEIKDFVNLRGEREPSGTFNNL